MTYDAEFPVIIKWKSVDYEPEGGMPIVWVSRNGRVSSFKTVTDWAWQVKKYNIFCWAYVEKIIPSILNDQKNPGY